MAEMNCADTDKVLKPISDLLESLTCVAIDGYAPTDEELKNGSYGHLALYLESAHEDCLAVTISIPTEVLDEYNINWYDSAGLEADGQLIWDKIGWDNPPPFDCPPPKPKDTE